MTKKSKADLPEFQIDITIDDEKWLTEMENIENHSRAVISTAYEEAQSSKLADINTIELSIMLTDNATIRELNNEYRLKDKPTNVLSFPLTENTLVPLDGFLALGDVVVALETIQEEAKQQDKTFPDHYTHMLVHGLLHLLHYDHETDEDAEVMEDLEIKILDQMKIKNPYETKAFYAKIGN